MKWKWAGKEKNKVLQERRGRSEEKLRHYAAYDENRLFDAFETSKKGLSHEKVEALHDEGVFNRIEVDHKDTVFSRIIEATVNPFNVVLLMIALITFITDVVLSPKKDFVTVIVILGLVFLSSAIAFVQSQRSSAAAEKLSRMISNKVDLWREGKLVEVLLEEVVPGDIVRLSAGDIIPADVRFLSAKDAFIAQAALTGESNPVEKFARLETPSDGALTDLSNIGFMGSNMVSGSATALVLATGNDTYFGAMAETLSGDKAKNSFERGVDSVSKLLIRFMLVMVPVVFFINGLTKHDWMASLLFAITIAVGLTPEMLPVIMTSALARGAVSMSKRKVIVKSLGSIQAFGEMDVLCTDKTGTLTEDKIILEKYMDSHGNDDLRVLRHAYLNSAFQTGLKNLIDIAIINRARENDLEGQLSGYTLIDEIPFDFSRRRMSVVLTDASGKRQLIAKGAVEEMLAICSFIEYEGKVEPLSEDMRREAMGIYQKHNDEGLRMLAVAQKNDVADSRSFGVADERDMVLIGFVGFLDPPKKSAKGAIAALQAHGVRVVVLTGDSEGVAVKVCGQVGVDVSRVISGRDVEAMDDDALFEAVKTCDLFAKLSPMQKQRVVIALQKAGHTVGYMGDGINDAPPIRQADIGISVDSAVDIAKETADIILLEKDLMVLEEGVLEGRKTFGNIVKYIKMAASGNFGNMISVIVASLLLPFLPMLPVQILTQNLLCDLSQLGMSFDHVDEEYIRRPRRWDTASIRRFMMTMGPISSLFDVLCFALMWYVMGANAPEHAALFQAGWFVFGTLSQVVIIHMIRSAKVPVLKSNASWPLYLSTAIVAVVAVFIAFTPFARGIDMQMLPLAFAPWLALLLIGYCACVQLYKHGFVRRYGEWM